MPLSFFFMVGKAQKLHGVRCELNSLFSLKKQINGTPLEHLPYSPDLASSISGFSNMKREL
jgi:hypothetical protein